MKIMTKHQIELIGIYTILCNIRDECMNYDESLCVYLNLNKDGIVSPEIIRSVEKLSYSLKSIVKSAINLSEKLRRGMRVDCGIRIREIPETDFERLLAEGIVDWYDDICSLLKSASQIIPTTILIDDESYTLNCDTITSMTELVKEYNQSVVDFFKLADMVGGLKGIDIPCID